MLSNLFQPPPVHFITLQECIDCLGRLGEVVVGHRGEEQVVHNVSIADVVMEIINSHPIGAVHSLESAPVADRQQALGVMNGRISSCVSASVSPWLV